MTDPITPTYTLIVDSAGNDVSGSIFAAQQSLAAMQQAQLMLFVLVAIALGLWLALRVLP